MPKIRKTKSQKLKSQSRFVTASIPSSSPSSTAFSYTVSGIKNIQKSLPDYTSYGYVFHDLKKTLLLTGIIILAQILLFFFLGNK